MKTSPPPTTFVFKQPFFLSFSVLGSVKISVHPELFWKSVVYLCHFWCSEFISHSLSLNLYHLVHSFIYTYPPPRVLALAGRLTGCWHLTGAAHVVRCGRMWEGTLTTDEYHFTRCCRADLNSVVIETKRAFIFANRGIPRSRPVSVKCLLNSSVSPVCVPAFGRCVSVCGSVCAHVMFALLGWHVWNVLSTFSTCWRVHSTDGFKLWLNRTGE